MTQQVLACTCGDCTHWEIISGPKPTSVIWRTLEAITPHFQGPPHGILKCKTCGKEFPATVILDLHNDLKEIEREA